MDHPLRFDQPWPMKNLLLLVFLFGLAGCELASTGFPPEDDTVDITLLVVYTPEAAVAAGDINQIIDDAVSTTNAAYRASGVDITLNVVHRAEIAYQMTERFQDVARLVHQSDGFLDEVHPLRNEVEADIVLLVPDRAEATMNAAIMAVPENAFAVVHWEHLDAPVYGLAHELGHLQGARHSLIHDTSVEPFAWGHGFRNDQVRTIMANGPMPRVPRFSGPGQVWEGHVLGDALTADVVRVLNETAVYVSNFRGSDTPTPFVSPGTWPSY